MYKIYLKLLFIISIFTGDLIASNHLANQTSPYLLQHKNNPVNWYPWGDEAFNKAKKEHKLIFLSIGYSTCHWCHIMAKESFEDKNIAKILNKYFISIKVDKEQYPHIDNYYQNIYRIMNNRSGGWPLSLILTSDKKPIFSATYIPKEQGYGSLGFKNILLQISSMSKQQLQQTTKKIDKLLTQQQTKNIKTIQINKSLALKTIKQYQSYFDYKNKGFSISPKFPQANNIILLYKLYQITNDKDALNMANSSLIAMAQGGIYDQISGGFFRYTVDKKWLMPHFEKMLYTNGELIEAYNLGYQITHNKLFKKVIENTIKEIDKRFMINHLYKSASNADSPNNNNIEEEGYYFMFEYDKTFNYLKRHHIKNKEIKEALNYLGIEKDGNFDGELNNPYITSNKIPKNIERIISLLENLKDTRVYPFIDFKINTAWNSLYIKAKLQASIIDKRYLKEALQSLDTLINIMYINNTLYHQTIDGKKPTQKALLEDYAFLSSCVFEAYQLTLDKKYFNLFVKLTKTSIDKFYKNNSWKESDDKFITNAKISQNGYASALAINIQNLIKYATIKADFKLYQIAKKTLDSFSYKINNYPAYYPNTTLAQLQIQYEPIFIKSNYTNLKNISLESINYPFIYKYTIQKNIYLACKLNSCFSYSNNFDIIKKNIENK